MSLESEELTLVFAEDPLQFIARGEAHWKSLDTKIQVPESGGLGAAAARGVLALCKDSLAVEWVYAQLQQRRVRVLITNGPCLHGLNFPVNRLVFFDVPHLPQAVVHACGRLGRRDYGRLAEIFVLSEREAKQVLLPQIRDDVFLHFFASFA